jgi:cell division protease FtsH
MLPESERHTLDEPYLKSQLVTLLAGRASERLYLGSVSSGADDDIRRATEIARSMVARWGMTEDLGPVDLRQSDDHPFLGQSIAQPRSHADATAAQVDAAVIALLKSSEDQAASILSDHKLAIANLIAKLEVEETLEFDEIARFLDPDSKVTPLKLSQTRRDRVPPTG